MKNIYLFGASDDCMECETDFDGEYESYVGIMIGDVRVHYAYDGDWSIWLEGEIPADWKVHSCMGNADYVKNRDKPHLGQFIHIQLPADASPAIKELSDEGEE